MTQAESTKAATRSWLGREQRAGRAAARPVLMLHILGTVLGVAQAFLAASVLASAFAAAAIDPVALAAFGVLAVLRAAVSYLTERAAFAAGAASRRRLRSDALSRLLQAGPALLRTRHSGDLATIVVDRIEALDGLFAHTTCRAATFAMVGPCVVLLAVLYADPWAALLLLGCGLLVPVGMAVAGLGAAAASRNQFLAMTRLQARFLDRVRGIATIVLYGRAGDEQRSLAHAASELRVRTMRVLRVAFLSSVVLDLAAALAMVVLAIHYFNALRLTGFSGDMGPALAVLLLTPEFFAAAADVLRRVPGPAARDRRGGGASNVASAAGTGTGTDHPHRQRAGRHGRVRQGAPELGRIARPGAGRVVVPRRGGGDVDTGGAVGVGKVLGH